MTDLSRSQLVTAVGPQAEAAYDFRSCCSDRGGPEVTDKIDTLNRTDLRYATLKVAQEGSLTQLKRLWMTPQAESTLGQLERLGLVSWGSAAYELTEAGAAVLARWEAA